MENIINNPTDALAYILAGKALVTFRNKVTGNRYTYKVKQADTKDIYFVSYLTGQDNTSDYTFLGIIGKAGNFVTTKKSRLPIDSVPVKGFKVIFESLINNKPSDKLEVWHSGRCGKCGRVLTDPDSIASGIGPVCASY